MRVMVIVKADKNSEAGVLPTRELLSEMGKFNEQLAKAGVMLGERVSSQPQKESGSSFQDRRAPSLMGPSPSQKS